MQKQVWLDASHQTDTPSIFCTSNTSDFTFFEYISMFWSWSYLVNVSELSFFFLSFFLISLEVGLPSATKRASIDWFQGAYWWFHNLGTGTQKAWPPLGSARQPSQQGGLHLLAWETSSCRIKAHSPTHWSLSWKQYSPPSLAAG